MSALLQTTEMSKLLISLCYNNAALTVWLGLGTKTLQSGLLFKKCRYVTYEMCKSNVPWFAKYTMPMIYSCDSR